MRHRKAGRKLKRTASHKKALLNSLSTSLIRNKRIRTTLAKAKETRPFIEKLITRAKNAVAGEENSTQKNVHARREISRYIKDREIVKELFNEIAQKVNSRAGGYTRVIKLGRRLGDGAEMGLLELVDFPIGKETPKVPAKIKKAKRGWTKKTEAAKQKEETKK
jgi:large subunit ribosomal protein L17